MSELLCRGSWALGTACGTCSRCLATKPSELAAPVCSTFSGEIPPEIRAKMGQDREEIEAGLWWMIEHPTRPLWWTGNDWADASGPVKKYTTRGEAECERDRCPQLEDAAVRITQHGPAIEKGCENIDGQCAASWCDCDYQRRKPAENSAPALEWEYFPTGTEQRGWLRGQPEITLFVIGTHEDKHGRKLGGAFVPDADEESRSYPVVRLAKAAAEEYLAAWMARNMPNREINEPSSDS